MSSTHTHSLAVRRRLMGLEYQMTPEGKGLVSTLLLTHALFTKPAQAELVVRVALGGSMLGWARLH